MTRAFKTPSLRNVTDRASCMHAGQISTLADVVAHYNRAPASSVGASELRPLRLNQKEQAQLVAFLSRADRSIEVAFVPAGPANIEVMSRNQ